MASLYLRLEEQEKDVSGFANYAQITALLSTPSSGGERHRGPHNQPDTV